MEYARYSASPTGYVQREDADQDWRDVPSEDAQLAQDAIIKEKLEGARAAQQGRLNTTIIRSPRNEDIAARLGLTGDELAENLARSDRNSGTRRRVPEEEFDAAMRELGLDPQEARDRLAGRYRDIG